MKVIEIKDYRKKINQLKELNKLFEPLLDKMNIDDKKLKLNKTIDSTK